MLDAGLVGFVQKTVAWLVLAIRSPRAFSLSLGRGRAVPQEYPQYYVLIQRPISLSCISQRIGAGGYATLNEFAADLRLIFDNARTCETSATIAATPLFVAHPSSG